VTHAYTTCIDIYLDAAFMNSPYIQC